MFLLTKPDEHFINEFLDARREDTFSYGEIGASRLNAPAGYNIDHNRIQLGKGREDFEKATEAIKRWKMFDIPWVKLYPRDAPIEVGQNVAVLINHLSFWSLNASRIVYILDEQGDVEKYGFAYGTLSEHGERGEERFSVELHHSSGEVWYDLFAFSRPKHIFAMLGYPVTRYLQKQFAWESKEAMKRFVDSPDALQA